MVADRLDVGGYVLAGGRSSRMGKDKALLQLAGKTLAERAASKLRQVCADVSILAGEPETERNLEIYGSLVFDLHPQTGPIGGVEAALMHSRHDLNLIIPVDAPFVPASFLDWWVRIVAARPRIMVSSLSVSGRLQPTFLLIRRRSAPFLTEAISKCEYKLVPALEHAASELAGPQAPAIERAPHVVSVDEDFRFEGWHDAKSGGACGTLSPEQRAAQRLWFANLNTPEDLAVAEANSAALETERT